MTFNMVRGAPKGSVNCCSNSAARASDTVEGASAAIDPAVRSSARMAVFFASIVALIA